MARLWESTRLQVTPDLVPPRAALHAYSTVSQRHTEARDIYRADKPYTSIYVKAAKKYAIHRIDVRDVVEGGLEMNAQGCDM